MRGVTNEGIFIFGSAQLLVTQSAVLISLLDMTSLEKAENISISAHSNHIYRILKQEEEADFINNTKTAIGVITRSKHKRHMVWLIEAFEACTYEACVNNEPCCMAHAEIDGNLIVLHNLNLKHGQHYKLCAKSNETVLQEERFTRVLPSFKTCSDGFLVDTTPPQAGVVNVGNGFYETSPGETCMDLQWSGFLDEEEAQLTNDNGLAYFVLAVGKFRTFQCISG